MANVRVLAGPRLARPNLRFPRTIRVKVHSYQNLRQIQADTATCRDNTQVSHRETTSSRDTDTHALHGCKRFVLAAHNPPHPRTPAHPAVPVLVQKKPR
jgi:hypothetical protein